ncbi:MAG: hypothetical protein V3V08_10855 [Nannocystaceae bacterium]
MPYDEVRPAPSRPKRRNKRRLALVSSEALRRTLVVVGLLAGGATYLSIYARDSQRDPGVAHTVAPNSGASETHGVPGGPACGRWRVTSVAIQAPRTKDGRLSWDTRPGSAAPDLRLSLTLGAAKAIESEIFGDVYNAMWNLQSAAESRPGARLRLEATDVDLRAGESITHWDVALPTHMDGEVWDLGAAQLSMRCVG